MKSLKGQLLIASPGLSDPNFVRTVVLVAEHDAEGAFGVILNRPGSVKVADLWSCISEEPCEADVVAFNGGPVHENAVVFLHRFVDLVPESEPVIPGVFLGSEAALLSKVLGRVADSQPAGSASAAEEKMAAKGGDDVRVFCGYAGWGPGQLDGEMETGGWLTLPAEPSDLFKLPPERLWNLALERLGGVYRFFSLMPTNPELN